MERFETKVAAEAAARAQDAAAAKADAAAAAPTTPAGGPLSRYNLGGGSGAGAGLGTAGGGEKTGTRYDREYVTSDGGSDAKRRKINKKLDYEAWKQQILAGAGATT